MSAWESGPPRSTINPVSEILSLSEKNIGCQIHLKTTLGEEIKGELFAYDSSTQTIVIQDKLDNKKVGNVRTLKASFVKEVLKVEERAQGVEYDMTLPPLDAAQCQAREAAAIKTAEDDAKKIGVGVSELAQDIFDAMSKTLPCKWSDKSIIVMDDVKIDDPYTPECCKGSKDTSLSRVRKVLEGERARLTAK